jgi:DNA-binding HxlR family transcriptional regulator
MQTSSAPDDRVTDALETTLRVKGEGAKADATEGDCAESSKSCDGALAQAFKLLGKRWNGVILGTLANGSSGFSELKRNVNGISDSVLSERLSELHSAGLIIRSVDPGPPVAVSYDLSESGRALIPALEALIKWASNSLPTPLVSDH